MSTVRVASFLFAAVILTLAMTLVPAGVASASVFTQVTSTSEVVEPLSVGNQVNFEAQIWPCESTILTFDIINEAPVPYGVRLTPGECTFPEGVGFGEILVDGEPYTWGDTFVIPANGGMVSCSIEVVAACDAAPGIIRVIINIEKFAPGPPEYPTIGFSPSSFSFAALEGGDNPSDKILSIWNSGGGTLDWTVSDDADWLTLSPASGTDSGEVTVSVDITGMSAGDYDGTITISAPGATNTPVTVPVSLSILVEWWEIEYEAVEGYITVYASVDGGIPYRETSSAVASGCMLWISPITFTDEHGAIYREIFLPQASNWSAVWASEEAYPGLGWVTILLVMTGNGGGRLYVDDWGDVDVAGETTESGTALTWGDGVPDPAGSAWLHLPLRADVYFAPVGGAMPDPEDPATWGTLGLEVPVDVYMTTGVTENHVTDTAEPATPGTALTCSTKIDAGVPFAAGDGDPAPYVGTSATLVAAGAALDLMFESHEIDFQFISATEIAPVGQ